MERPAAGGAAMGYGDGGFYAFACDRCTGGLLAIASDDMEVGEKNAWCKLAVKNGVKP